MKCIDLRFGLRIKAALLLLEFDLRYAMSVRMYWQLIATAKVVFTFCETIMSFELELLEAENEQAVGDKQRYPKGLEWTT